jgi:glycosyltransferase involved in cell wall biosynthesis
MGTFQEHNRISVVIPTLEAAADLPATLAGLANRAVVREVVVADGGSRDATVGIARDAGAHVGVQEQ